jgi:glycolate oxidase FAD binding subunit
VTPPGMIEQFRDRIRAAAAARTPLRIRGGGSKDFYGREPAGEVLDTREHAGIAAYEPTELYVTARCGTRLADLEAALEENNQMLAFEPPHFGEGTTVGGMVAAGLSGPRRQQAGALRDFVLGVRLIDGRGDELRFGGTVMKNVAGYDVSRLVTGSLGTLGLITEATLKVLPRAPAELSLRFEASQAEAIQRLNEWAGLPLPISASAWHAQRMTIRLSGNFAALAAARARLGGEPLDDFAAGAFWRALRNHDHEFFQQGVWRIAVPSTAAALALPGDTLLECNGGVRWISLGVEAATLRDAARAAGGSATLFRADARLKRSAGVFDPPSPLMAALHQRVKQVFDPAGIFNPERMHAGF